MAQDTAAIACVVSDVMRTYSSDTHTRGPAQGPASPL